MQNDWIEVEKELPDPKLGKALFYSYVPQLQDPHTYCILYWDEESGYWHAWHQVWQKDFTHWKKITPPGKC